MTSPASTVCPPNRTRMPRFSCPNDTPFQEEPLRASAALDRSDTTGESAACQPGLQAESPTGAAAARPKHAGFAPRQRNRATHTNHYRNDPSEDRNNDPNRCTSAVSSDTNTDPLATSIRSSSHRALMLCPSARRANVAFLEGRPEAVASMNSSTRRSCWRVLEEGATLAAPVLPRRYERGALGRRAASDR